MMNYEQFIKAYENTKIGDGECVASVKKYITSVFSIPSDTWGNAADYFNKYDNNATFKENFTKIKNTPTFVPQKGDIAVWTESHDGLGHVAIATGEGDTSYFYSYDQNWTDRKMKKERHNYSFGGFAGVLRPKSQDSLYTMDILDLDLYRAIYSDLNSLDDAALIRHFFEHGLDEGRRISYVFDTQYYRNNNSDLKDKTNYDLYNHFIFCGIKEQRLCCQEFNSKYYVQKNSDLKNLSSVDAFSHFLNSGINEFRYSSSEFNVTKYKDNNKDLKERFGNNCKEYYKHWICYGKNEGRIH